MHIIQRLLSILCLILDALICSTYTSLPLLLIFLRNHFDLFPPFFFHSTKNRKLFAMLAYWNLGVWMHEVHVSKNFEYTTASEEASTTNSQHFWMHNWVVKKFYQLTTATIAIKRTFSPTISFLYFSSFNGSAIFFNLLLAMIFMKRIQYTLLLSVGDINQFKMKNEEKSRKK